MSVNRLILLLLFVLTSITGLSAEISVFLQTGASLQLDIHTQQLPEFDLLSWTYNISESIVRYNNDSKEVIRHNSYKDRVDLNDTSFSLTLKNMQKTDSGLYTARISGSNHKDIVKYKISVIDAVEAPVLTVNSVWSRSDSCTVRFTCTAHELMINSTYQNISCSPEEVTSHEINTLILDCREKTIICNHSNPVSWKEDQINIIQLCEDKTPKNPPLLWIAVGLAVCVLIICVSIILYYKYKKGSLKIEQTIYAEVDDKIKSQKSQKSLEMLQKSKNPQTVYDAVGDAGQTDVTIYSSPSDGPVNQSVSLSEKSKPGAPFTIYCAIQKQPNNPKTEPENTIYAVVNKQSARYESAHPQSE